MQPPGCLLAVLLPLPVWAIAGSLSVIVTGGLVLVMGPDVWRQWLAMSAAVDWLPLASNASLWGWAARIQSGNRPIGMTDLAGPLVVALGLAAAWLA